MKNKESDMCTVGSHGEGVICELQGIESHKRGSLESEVAGD